MTSWLGQGAQDSASVLSLFSFISLYFLAKELNKVPKFSQTALTAGLLGSALASVIIIPSIFGADLGILSNVIGTPHATAIYLLVLTTLSCGLWLVDYRPAKPAVLRMLYVASGLTYLTTLLLLLVLDSPLLWGLAIVATGILFIVALVHADKFQDPLRFMPVMLVFVLAVIFLILPTRLPSPFLQEVSPNLATTWSVTTGAWNEGSVALGTGPGTFSLVYPKYSPLDVNTSDFWELVFDRGNSQITTLLATNGLVGVMSWLFFVVLVCLLGAKKILKSEPGWLELIPIFSAWLVLVIAACVYPQNFTLSFIFWWLSAGLVGQLYISQAVPKPADARSRLAMVFVSVLVLVTSFATIFVSWPRYGAEVAFAKAVNLNLTADTKEEVDEVISLLDKASTKNPRNDTYYRNLAGAFLRRLSLLSSEEAADDAYVQSILASTIAAATRATDISPANVLNWDVRGLVYRDVLPVVPEAAQPSIDAYEQAIVLAPINPRYRVEAARAYLGVADAQNPLLESEDRDIANEAKQIRERSIAKAEEHLTTAVALKPDYAPAHYYLALLKEREGQLAEAVRGLEYVKTQAPEDVGVGLELGLLYLRQGKNELAQAELQRVIALAPTYANAHWYLSVVFEQQGDLIAAVAEVEKVLDTNPENVAVQARLDRLKAGQTSTEIPEPLSLSSQ
jgi:tetratricopeptide (TPR) repeat protein